MIRVATDAGKTEMKAYLISILFITQAFYLVNTWKSGVYPVYADILGDGLVDTSDMDRNVHALATSSCSCMLTQLIIFYFKAVVPKCFKKKIRKGAIWGSMSCKDAVYGLTLPL